LTDIRAIVPEKGEGKSIAILLRKEYVVIIKADRKNSNGSTQVSTDIYEFP
jgi:hypothetical protein